MINAVCEFIMCVCLSAACSAAMCGSCDQDSSHVTLTFFTLSLPPLSPFLLSHSYLNPLFPLFNFIFIFTNHSTFPISNILTSVFHLQISFLIPPLIAPHYLWSDLLFQFYCFYALTVSVLLNVFLHTLLVSHDC